jgi:hypothetical protein
VGALGGVDGEYVKVEFNRKEGAEAPMNTQILFVNGDSMVERAEATIDNPMEAGATMPVTVDFSWKSVGEGNILDKQVMSFSIDTPMGNIEQSSTVSFDYLEVGDLHVLVGMRTEMQTPMGPQSAEQRIENLIVNGEPVGRADAGEGEG